MGRYAPLAWLALSVVGLYGYRAWYRRGHNLYNPVVPEKERRKRNVRFAAYIAIYVIIAVTCFVEKLNDTPR